MKDFCYRHDAANRNASVSSAAQSGHSDFVSRGHGAARANGEQEKFTVKSWIIRFLPAIAAAHLSSALQPCKYPAPPPLLWSGGALSAECQTGILTYIFFNSAMAA